MNKENPSSLNRPTSEDEIDLGKLFERIGNFFLNCLLLLFKNIKILSSIVVSGIALSLVFYFLQKPVFFSEMTISSRFLTNDFCSVLIANLNKLVEEGNYNQLEHYLKIDKDLAEDIQKIEFQNLNTMFQDIDEDTILLKVPFKILVEVKNNQVLDTLGPAIAGFIENNKYAKRREKIEIDNLKNQIGMLAAQRSSLDSLKRMVLKDMSPRESKSGFVFGEPYEPLNIYKEEVVFFGKELELRKKLVEAESVEIIHDFTKYKYPKRRISISKVVLIGTLISVFVGILFIAIKELGKSLRRYERNHPETYNA